MSIGPAPSGPLSREGLAQQAYQRLRRDLMTGRFAPGQRLKLRELALELGISLTPVREALARLVSEQALVQAGHGAVRVPTMSAARFEEIKVLRLRLEGLAAETAARIASLDEIDRLEEVHKQLWRARLDNRIPDMLLENERFHIGLCELARMPVLLKIVESLWLQCGPLMMGFMRWLPAKPPRPHPHAIVLAGLRARDPAEARRGIEADITGYAESLARYLEEMRAQEDRA